MTEEQNHKDNGLKRVLRLIWSPRNRIFLILSLLIVSLLAVLLWTTLMQKSNTIEELPTPPRTLLRKFGADFSSWQDPNSIDYDTLALRLDFAILRAGFTGHDTGTALKSDNAFEEHYKNFNERNVPIGVYWYSCADSVEKAVVEAQAVLRHIKGKNISYPVFFDTEDEYFQIMASPEVLTDAALAFCQTIEAAGYKAGIYSHAYWFRDRMELERLSDYEIWLASWNEVPEQGVPYDILQFTEEGRLAGYDGPLDLNFSNKDYQRKSQPVIK